MPYADSDFFVALLLPNDRHRVWAEDAYKRYKGDITTSLATVIELLLISKKLKITAQGLINEVLGLAGLIGISDAEALLAGYLIDNYNIGVFDAVHAALCNGKIISTDHIYRLVGIDTVL